MQGYDVAVAFGSSLSQSKYLPVLLLELLSVSQLPYRYRICKTVSRTKKVEPFDSKCHISELKYELIISDADPPAGSTSGIRAFCTQWDFQDSHSHQYYRVS